VTPAPRSSRRRALQTAAASLLAVAGLLGSSVLTSVPPAQAEPLEAAESSRTTSYLCTGYVGCAQAGYSHFGYRAASSEMWWRMYEGHNCTNYVAYRMVKNGMSAERPWDGTGMAYNWGRANRSITDDTPMVGSVAWFDAYDGVGSSGHVAYVQKVVSNRKIVISEDSWGGDFHWRTITKDGGGWPTGFIHFADRSVAVKQAPEVTGTPRIGEVLTADTGSWRSATAYDVQWLSGGTPIEGATGTTLTVTQALLDTRISVRVTATARGYLDGTATSDRTTLVRRGLMSPSTAPTITGTPRVDEVLTLSRGSVSPAADRSTVAWYADGVLLDGVTGNKLVLGQEQIGARITADVTYRKDGYQALRATTEPTATVEAGRFTVSEPFTLTGRPQVGRTLTVAPGSYTPADAQVTYTWLRGSEVVEGRTGPTYTVDGADLGQQLSVRVDLTHPGYQDASETLPTERTVTTVPDLSVEAIGMVRKAVVKLRLTAPGVDQVSGPASVRIDGRTVTGVVEDGRLRLVVRDLDPGRYAARVRYDGTELVESAAARAPVRVTRR
jgi:surface antigen